MNKKIQEEYNVTNSKKLGKIIYITDFNYSKYIFWKFFALIFIIFCIYMH